MVRVVPRRCARGAGRDDPVLNGGGIPHSRPWITSEDLDRVAAVLRGGMIAQGALVARLEADVCRELGARGGVATASGTAALVLALRTLAVASGAEVVLPTYVCRSVLDAVLTVGASPVLCDVGHGYVLTPETVRPHLTPRTAAIIAVHIFGLPADVAALARLGVPVIEDACQAFGVRTGGRALGTSGLMGVFSFHATKCLTTGEGGMVVTNDERLLARARALRDGGLDGRVAAPMSDLQAALGLSQLHRYDQFITRRDVLRARYRAALPRCAPVVGDPAGAEGFFRLPLRVAPPVDALRASLAARGVQSRRGVDALLHRDRGLSDGDFPTAVRLFDETLSLPFYPALSAAECDAVIAALEAAPA